MKNEKMSPVTKTVHQRHRVTDRKGVRWPKEREKQKTERVKGYRRGVAGGGWGWGGCKNRRQFGEICGRVELILETHTDKVREGLPY